jgi:hypothetical protein
MFYSRLTRSSPSGQSSPFADAAESTRPHSGSALNKTDRDGFPFTGRATAFTVQPVMHGAHVTGADQQALDSARVSLAAYGILADAAFSLTQRLRCGRNAIHDIVVDSCCRHETPG